MWLILKFDKSRLGFLKEDIKKKVGKDFIIYKPKILIEKFKKNKLIKVSEDILNDYLFCFHSSFKDKENLEKLKYTRGLKHFLTSCDSYQKQIETFIDKCKSLENDNGYISQSIFDLHLGETYKFKSGPFVDRIFKIISFEKNKISTLMGNIKTTINKKNYIYSH